MKILPFSRENRAILGTFVGTAIGAFFVFYLASGHFFSNYSPSEKSETSGGERKEMTEPENFSGEAGAGDKTTVSVDLLPEGARPDVVTVPLGGFVQFNTKDGKKHSMSQGAGNQYEHMHEHNETGANSPEFGEGEAYRVDFKKVGTYYFHDHLNANLAVTVIVYQSES